MRLALLVLVGCGRIGFDAHGDASVAGTGSCTFRSPMMIAADSGTRAIAAGDLDGDRIADLVATNGTAGNVSVVLGGSFVSLPAHNVGMHPYSLALGDINGDGQLDAAVGNYVDNTVSILLGDGMGRFTDPGATPVYESPQGTALADIDHDGKLDLLTASHSTNTPGISLSLGNGDGTFALQNLFAGAGPSYSVALGDWDRDGNLDAVAVSDTAGAMRLFHGAGNNQLATSGTYATGPGTPKPWHVTTADLDGNGSDDIIVANNYSTANLAIFLDGGFSSPLLLPASTTPWTVVAGDVTGDGKLDLITADGLDDTLSVFAGHGDGTFEPRAVFPDPSQPLSVTLADLDGDGHLDVATANQGTNAIAIYLSTCAP